MTISDEDFKKLEEDIREQVNDNRLIKVKQKDHGRWNRFAEIHFSAGEATMVVAEISERLEEAGYVTGLKFPDSDHKSVYLKVSLTLDVYERVLEEPETDGHPAEAA